MTETIKAVREMPKGISPAYVVLGTGRGLNGYWGQIENSFSMALSSQRVQLLWSSQNATSNFGGHFVVEGRKNAEKDLAELTKKYPDIEWKIWDVSDENIPIEIDWDQWEKDSAPSEKKLSGVVNKFGARNVTYTIRSDE